jgi:hypothetical protein
MNLRVAILIVSLFALPQPCLSQSTYFNALTNQSTINTGFQSLAITNLSFPAVLTNSVPGFGSFVAGTNGINFLSSDKWVAFGYAYREPLSLKTSWTAKVKVQISTFNTGTNNTEIGAGISLYQYNTNFTDFSSILNYAFGRSFVRGGFLRYQDLAASRSITNYFTTGTWAPDSYEAQGSLDQATAKPGEAEATNVWVSAEYRAPSKRITFGFSRDGTNYVQGSSWNLDGLGDIGQSENLLLILTAANSKSSYSLTTNQVVVSDFSVTPSSTGVSGDVLLSLEKSSNNLSNWKSELLSTEQLTATGEINAGRIATNSSNVFYRLRIKTAP